jgi:hypothetical protein
MQLMLLRPLIMACPAVALHDTCNTLQHFNNFGKKITYYPEKQIIITLSGRKIHQL